MIDKTAMQSKIISSAPRKNTLCGARKVIVKPRPITKR